MNKLDKMMIKVCYYICRYFFVFVMVGLWLLVSHMDYQDHNNGCSHKYCETTVITSEEELRSARDEQPYY